MVGGFNYRVIFRPKMDASEAIKLCSTSKTPQYCRKAALQIIESAIGKTGCALEDLSPTNHEGVMSLSRALTHAAEERIPGQKDRARHLRLVRRSIALLRPGLQRAVVVPRAIASPKHPHTTVLQAKYAQLGPSHPVYKLLMSWVDIVWAASKCMAESSVKCRMSFYCSKLIPQAGLRLEDWDLQRARFALESLCSSDTRLTALCQPDPSSSLTWVRFFLEHIAQSSCQIPRRTILLMRHKQKAAQKAMTNVGDRFRISKHDLEILHNESVKDPFREMFFMTLLTTGMRIGAFCRIRTSDVADLGDKWVCRELGKTIEKGQQPITFKINERVRTLIEQWLTSSRPAVDSPYLFPPACGGPNPITPAHIREHFTKMCKACGVKARVHGLRHSFAHILSQLGNSNATISRLINHSCTLTTSIHYLRETTEEIYARANIPWMPKEDKPTIPDPVPSFLLLQKQPTATQMSATEVLGILKDFRK
jgi:hypothetical protein